jgi:peroxiredoxin
MQTLTSLPENLPIPVDDGACNHLLSVVLPDVSLPATDGQMVNLSRLVGWVVLFCYPKTGQPNQALPKDWDSIPGARGCTPQACGFRDSYANLTALGAQIFGLSAQDSEYQQEAVQRLHLPFALLSDLDLAWSQALQLPTFDVNGMRLNKRVTLILQNGTIQHYFYPVFPPDAHAIQVHDWLKAHV